MRNLTIAMIAVVFLSAACSNNTGNGNKEQTLSGTITNAEGQEVTLLGFPKGQPDTLGTAVLSASGEFSFPVSAGPLAFYSLMVGETESIVLAFDSTQSPVVTADFTTMTATYDVSNSKDSKELRDSYIQSYTYEKSLDSLMNALQEAAKIQDNEARVALSKEYNEMRIAYKDFLTEHIDADSTSIANFSVLQRLNPEEDFPYFVKVRNGLSPRLKGNTFFDQMANQIAQMEIQKKAESAFAPGALAPDIVLPSPEGPEIALSSLRGNYVLIDFWAAWCKPCRIENPNIVKMYKKYENENFEIFGVSLDQNRDKWIEAIAKDNLTWPQVSDLGYWQSAAAKLYNITSIPYTVLLDPEGKIIATRLRGKPLEDKMASIFGH